MCLIWQSHASLGRHSKIKNPVVARKKRSKKKKLKNSYFRFGGGERGFAEGCQKKKCWQRIWVNISTNRKYLAEIHKDILSMKVFLIALLLVAVPALALEAEEQHEEKLDCYAIRMGLPVSYSSIYPSWNSRIVRLDAKTQAWIARANNGEEWIQVSSAIKRKWIGVVTQGREQGRQWVKSYKVLHSNDGVYWDEVDDGYSFPGNTDWNTHVKHWFDTPVNARSIRLVPKSWYRHISMRLDFIFEC